MEHPSLQSVVVNPPRPKISANVPQDVKDLVDFFAMPLGEKRDNVIIIAAVQLFASMGFAQ